MLHLKNEFNGRSQVNLVTGSKVPLFGNYKTTVGHSEQSVEHTVYAGTVDYDFDWATLTSTSSYARSKWLSYQDLSYGLSDYLDSLAGNPAGTTTSVPYYGDLGSEKFTQEIRLTSEENTELEWIFGLYYTDSEAFDFEESTAVPTNANVIVYSTPADYREYAAYGNITYYLTPNFDLTAGLRVSRNESDFSQMANGLLATGIESPFASTVNDSVSTWLFAARYRANENMSVYARAASGYRPALAALGFTDPLTGKVYPPLIESDELWSYELGVKGAANDGILSYDLAAWYIDWENMQFAASTLVGGATVNIPGGITAHGFESNITLRPLDGLSLVAGIAYSRSTFNEDEPLLNAQSGLQLTRIPKWQAIGKARYDFARASELNPQIGLGVRYESSSPNDFDPSLNLVNDAYLMVDMDAGVNWKNMTLNVFVTNLLDEFKYVSIRSLSSISNFNPLRPRTVGMNVNYRF